VWIMTSWTKIWSCTGIRLGSVVAPTAQDLLAIKAKQVPWSVNGPALVRSSSGGDGGSSSSNSGGASISSSNSSGSSSKWW